MAGSKENQQDASSLNVHLQDGTGKDLKKVRSLGIDSLPNLHAASGRPPASPGL